MPDEGGHIWSWYWALDAGRSSNGFGVNPIGYPEIVAWAALVGAQPSPEEIGIIKAMDCAALNEMAKRRD